MITKSNLKNMLNSAGFSNVSDEMYEKYYPFSDCSITVDFRNEKINYPENKGFKVNIATTTNFSDPENFVVLECVNRLLDKGYRPENIELERVWTLGHEQKGGRADICVTDQNGEMLFIVECKTYGSEYNKEMKNILFDGGQLISYWQQERGCKWLVLYASTINGNDEIEYITDSIDCSDDENILNLAKKDTTILLYRNAHTVLELYEVWKETYEQRFSGDIIFRDDSVAYDIGAKPLRKKDLKDFSENDKIVNRFEEILRHNNVSDKENAFNRLIALFICKLVDEMQKTDNDIVEFQYKVGTDTYESLQDRLQRLHKDGMEKFMREEIFYVSDDYAENLVKHDYGKGFYLTENIELAKEWAVCRPDEMNGWVHKYELDTTNLKVLDFQEYNVLSWLAELMKHRDASDSRRYKVLSKKFIAEYGIDTSDYDVIKGWRANASYFYIAKEFVRDNIDIEILEELLSLGGLGIQYCIKSELAYSKLAEVEDGLVSVDYSEFNKKYNERDIIARKRMRELVDSDANKVTNVFSTLFER